MQNPARFREYADECTRLAKRSSEKDKVILLEIAEAWMACAEEAERREAANPAAAKPRIGGNGSATTGDGK